MNEEERFDRELSGWMRDRAPGRPPAHLVPMAMTSIHATPQRRSTWFASPVSWFAVGGVGVVAVAVVAVMMLGQPRAPAPVGSGPPPTASASSVQQTASANATSTPPSLPSFTVGRSVDTNATWAKLSWRKLDANGPLASIRRIVRLSGGYMAIGGFDRVCGGTPLWTSMDGAHFEPTSFIPSAIVLNVVELKGMMIALVADPDTTECQDVASCAGTLSSLRALISVDRVNWQEGTFPNLASQGPINGEPLTAIGPGGLLVATSHGPLVAARSSDGLAWSLESGNFPPGFELAGLWGRPDGYAAVGTITSGPANNPGYTETALWSADGRTWSMMSQHAARPDFVAAVSEPGPLSSFERLVSGRDGAIAISHEGGTPGVAAWWHSEDGRSWDKVAEFPPLGPALREDGSSFGVPDGRLASDGSRMMAIRLDDRSAAWTSFDGSTWTPMAMDGPLPPDGDLLVLPNGVLLFDAESSWFGEATDQ